MGLDPITIAIAGSLIGAGVSYYQGQKQADAQKKAAAEAKKSSEEAMNKANQKSPNVADILAGNRAAGVQSGTMLTGGTGVDTKSLLLGGNTLLGM